MADLGSDRNRVLRNLDTFYYDGTPPPFEWVVAHAPDGTLDAVWNRGADGFAMWQVLATATPLVAARVGATMLRWALGRGPYDPRVADVLARVARAARGGRLAPDDAGLRDAVRAALAHGHARFPDDMAAHYAVLAAADLGATALDADEVSDAAGDERAESRYFASLATAAYSYRRLGRESDALVRAASRKLAALARPHVPALADVVGAVARRGRRAP